MSLALISSDRFAEHQTPPGHPESPERAEAMDVVANEWRQKGGEVVAPRAVTREQLARVHDEAHLRRIEETNGQARQLDPDTYHVTPESLQIALLAAGAAVQAVDRVMTKGGAAFALVRPPGHHAERNRAMGFCLYNNIAVAAAHARRIGASRVAIVDYDVHHGNGTQHTFNDPSVLYVSTHQFPFYPGTGAVDEVGRGEGEGFTVNVPLEVGAVDEDYRLVFRDIVLPVVRQFEPDVILVSAGFDAHERDPLAGMRLTTPTFGAMTMALRQVAEECCKGRLVAVTEGGYDIRALAQSLLSTVGALGAAKSTPPEWPASAVRSTRGASAIAAARKTLGRYWTL